MTEEEFRSKVDHLGDLTDEIFSATESDEKYAYAQEARALAYELSSASDAIVKDNNPRRS